MSKSKAAAADPASQVLDQTGFVMNLSNDFVACRQLHDLPPFAFTKNGRLPAGITAIGPYHDGSHDVLRRCRRCGLALTYHTDTSGRIVSYKPRRRYPHGFLAKGMGRISRTLAYDEGLDRVWGALSANAIKPAEEE